MNKITLAQLKEQQQISSLDEYTNKAYDKLVNILAFGTTQGFVEKKSIDLLDGWMDDVIRNEI